MKKIILTFLITTVVMPLSVFAKTERYFENKNGLEFSQEMYENFKKIGFNDSQIDEMTLETFQAYSNMDNVELDKTVEKYFRETTISGYKTTDVIVEEISKYEYENEIESENIPITRASTHETTYKKLVLNSLSISAAYPNKRAVSGILTWKKLPAVKSYDIFAARVTGGEIAQNTYTGSFTSTQKEYTDVNCIYTTSKNYTKNYSSTDSAWNTVSSGIGLSGVGYTAKLNNTPGKICYNDLGMFPNQITGYSSTINFQSVTGTVVYVSYQHASTEVSFNQVYKAYSFSNSGLGNVIYFGNSTLRNSYDGMAGVSLTL